MSKNALSRTQFANAVLEVVKKIPDLPDLHYDNAQFALVAKDAAQFSLFLENPYRVAQSMTEAERAIFISKAIVNTVRAGITDLPSDWSAARGSLLPNLRPRIDLLSSQPCEFTTMTNHIFGQHLAVDLLYDTPDAKVCCDKIPSTWGVSLDEVGANAFRNLISRSQEPFIRVGPRTYISPWKDNYDASRLLLTDLILKLPVRGRPVAMVPNRDQLIITGSDDADGLMTMARIAHAGIGQPYNLTGHAFILKGQTQQTWAPFLPPATNPAHDILLRLARQSIKSAFTAQMEVLRPMVSAHVAEYMVLQDQRCAKAFSAAVYSNEPSLLPQTERVLFCRVQPKLSSIAMLGWAPWEAVRKALGDRMVPLGLYPERYHLEGEITELEFQAMDLREMEEPPGHEHRQVTGYLTLQNEALK